MSGFLTNGMFELNYFTGAERFPLDTQQAAGEFPETGSLSLFRLATALLKMASNVDITTVAGTIYYRKFTVEGVATQFTGIEYLIGSAGGTDKVIVAVYNSTGATVVAQSDSTGVTVGTLNTWQQVPFKPGGSGTATPVTIQPGTYYLAIQSNGTTAKLRGYNGPGLTTVTGSQTGAFGTLAALSPLATTYTAGVGPVCELYQ